MTEISEKEKVSQQKSKKAAKEYTLEDIQKVLSTPEAQAIMQAIIAKELSAQKKEQYVPQVEKPVSILYMGMGAEGSMVHLNDKLGDIPVQGGTRDIPKKEFMENLTPGVLKRMRDRRLIILDGFTDDERERYGVNYKDGELIGKDVYFKLLGMDEDKIVSIFKKACPRHKQLIASIFADAYSNHDNRINLPLIKRLNSASKGTDPDGMFTAIQKDMVKSLGDEDEE